MEKTTVSEGKMKTSSSSLSVGEIKVKERDKTKLRLWNSHGSNCKTF